MLQGSQSSYIEYSARPIGGNNKTQLGAVHEILSRIRALARWIDGFTINGCVGQRGGPAAAVPALARM